MTEANSLYIRAAENGDPTAMTNLGIFAEESGNLNEAIMWYEQAAALDQEDAQNLAPPRAHGPEDSNVFRALYNRDDKNGRDTECDRQADEQREGGVLAGVVQGIVGDVLFLSPVRREQTALRFGIGNVKHCRNECANV